jgi:hypothetical protein
MAVRLAPIADADVAEVAIFLNATLNGRVSARTWARSMALPWKADGPNHGYLLRDGRRVVGAYLAFYSERVVGARMERFCNLGAWCVLPEYRLHSVRLLAALLAQDGYHFTDLSPSGSAVALGARLKFRALDTATALVPNLPRPTRPGRTSVSSDPEVIEAMLADPVLDIYRDHAHAAAARHLVLRHDGRSCYVMFRMARRKGLPVFAVILYVSDPGVFRGGIAALSRHLLARHRALATLAELRIVGRRPRPSVMLRSPRPKMYRSTSLEPAQIDDLYSELECVPW